MGDKLELSVLNNGISSNANNKIFNSVITDVQNFRIKRGDFVIVMWSSSLRDVVPFLPSGEWVSWSVKHLAEEPHKFLNSYNSEDEKFNTFFKNVRYHFCCSFYEI